MKYRSARVITYAVVASLAVAAIRLTPPVENRPAADVLSALRVAPSWRLHVDTLGRGESLRSLLTRGGVSQLVADEALRAASRLDPRRIPAGMPVRIRQENPDSTPSEITLQLSLDRFLHLRRTATGWTETEEKLAWKTDTVLVAGTINSTLYAAMDEGARELPAGARQQLTWSLADIFEYRVDMSRDLQQGDAFRVLAERSVAPTGAVRMGRILAATLTTSGSEHQAVRFGKADGRGEYFDGDGKSLRAAFLRAPLEFRRISSVFGMRFHPILRTWRQHKGTDYAATTGTPVRAIGDAVVSRAGWSNGYGNLLELRHPNGYVTRYGHMRAFAAGVHTGAHVSIGQTVGYVGTTGMSTAPHLHFEVLVNGAQRDPRSALRATGGFPIASADRGAFESLRTRLLAQLDGAAAGSVRVASR